MSYDVYPEDYLPLDGQKKMKGDLDMDGHDIENVSGLSMEGAIDMNGNTITNSPSLAGGSHNLFSTSASGEVPASGGGTTNFLRADGTWKAAGGGGASVSVNNNTPVTTGTAFVPTPLPSVQHNGVLSPYPSGISYAPALNNAIVSASRRGVCAAPDGTIWVTHDTTADIYHYSAAGVLLGTGTATGYTKMNCACIGPDNALYIGCKNGTTNYGIVKVTTDGAYTTTYYAATADTSHGYIYSVCAGADGAVYGTVNSATAANNKVVRISGGVLTGYATNRKYTTLVTPGPGGLVWWTTYIGNVDTPDYYGSINSAGTIVEYEYPAGLYNYSQSGMGGVTGPDGNWWLATYGNGTGAYTVDHVYYLKINASGTVLASYDEGTANGGQDAAVVGVDGKMYFANFSSKKYTTVTTQGAISTVSLSTTYLGGDGLCVAGDGSFWGSRNYSISRLPVVATTGITASAAPQTALTGSGSGALTWTMPEQGESSKKVIISLAAWADAGEVITYPTAFTYTPAIAVNSTGLEIVTLSTISITIPDTSAAPETGFIILEGF